MVLSSPSLPSLGDRQAAGRKSLTRLQSKQKEDPLGGDVAQSHTSSINRHRLATHARAWPQSLCPSLTAAARCFRAASAASADALCSSTGATTAGKCSSQLRPAVAVPAPWCMKSSARLSWRCCLCNIDNTALHFGRHHEAACVWVPGAGAMLHQLLLRALLDAPRPALCEALHLRAGSSAIIITMTNSTTAARSQRPKLLAATA